MTSEPHTIPNAYTDAPDLHPNLILGSLHLLFWLFVHPSAWRSYVARIDPALRPDFCFVELTREQREKPELKKLLVIGLVVYPVMAGLVVGFLGWTLDKPGVLPQGAFAYTVTFALALTLLVGLTTGVGFGLASSSTVSVLIGSAGVITFGTPDTYLYFIALVLATGITSSIALSLTIRARSYSINRQVGGVVFGVLIGVASVGFVVQVVSAPVQTLFPGNLAVLVTNGIIVGVSSVLIIVWKQRPLVGLMSGITIGTAYVLSAFIVVNTTNDLLSSITGAATLSWRYGIVIVLTYTLTRYIAGSLSGAVAVTFGVMLREVYVSLHNILWSSLPIGLVSACLGLTLNLWRPILFYPLLAMSNLMLFRLDERRDPTRPALLRYHPAFWDEHQRLPWVGLDDHLVLVAERNPAEGTQALTYVANSPHQRRAAQAAQIELDARQLERCADVTAIAAAHQRLGAGELQGPASALLRSFSRVSQDVAAALRQESAYNQRLALHAVEERLDGLLRELTRSSERYALRFRPVAEQWRQVVADHVRTLTADVESRQEIDSPYIIGVPLTAQQEIFVGRTDISARIEQLLLDRRRPPLLLYGQRRMGKTSLLNNLGRLLPSTIVPLFVDLQGAPTQASDYAGLLYNLARSIVRSAHQQRGLALPGLTRDTLAADPFTSFDEWLDAVEQHLGDATALLMLDEFEVLDKAIASGRFDEERVLGTVRHLIQHRPRFKVLLAGSHTLDEFRRWASYLINVQVVHLPYLHERETRQLIECPITDFALRYEPAASQRVLDLTRGHPFLVQLLCAEIVALKNEQEPAIRRLARLSDVEDAVPLALASGDMFFADMARNQVDAAGLALLRTLAAQGEGALVSRDSLAQEWSDSLDHALQQGLHREIIEAVDGGYCFQVELIRRWFAAL